MTIVDIEEATETLVKALQTHAYNHVEYGSRFPTPENLILADENKDYALRCQGALALLIGPVRAGIENHAAYERADLLVNGA